MQTWTSEAGASGPQEADDRGRKEPDKGGDERMRREGEGHRDTMNLDRDARRVSVTKSRAWEPDSGVQSVVRGRVVSLVVGDAASAGFHRRSIVEGGRFLQERAGG
jgi:hypothetical protein